MHCAHELAPVPLVVSGVAELNVIDISFNAHHHVPPLDVRVNRKRYEVNAEVLFRVKLRRSLNVHVNDVRVSMLVQVEPSNPSTYHRDGA